MNIFVLDREPSVAVTMLCDAHVRKMCLETAQILSGVMIRNGIKLADGMPRPQNVNHPVIKAVDTPQKTNWLLLYNYSLNFEYLRRFRKPHAYDKLADSYCQELCTPSGNKQCDTLAKCCGNLDVSGLDTVTAYRQYYTQVKKPDLMAKGLWKFSGREDWTNAL